MCVCICVGVGHFSSVRRCVNKRTKKVYAVKTIDKNLLNAKQKEVCVYTWL